MTKIIKSLAIVITASLLFAACKKETEGVKAGTGTNTGTVRINLLNALQQTS